MIVKLSAGFIMASIGLAGSAFAQSLPARAVGSWDVSAEECRKAGTSVTQVDITRRGISTYGGNAIVRQVVLAGPVTFVAADFLQTEGVQELGPRARNYFRLTQRDGRDRLNIIWKDVQTVDLVRCG